MNNLTLVPNEEAPFGCQETQNILRELHKNKTPFAVAWKNSKEGVQLWADSLGQFHGRTAAGHPLLVVKNEEGQVVWAGARPTTEETEEALRVLNHHSSSVA